MTCQRVWDELDRWHSCLAQLESDAQDLEKPEDTVTIIDKLMEVQRLHSQLAKQAEQRTALIGKVRTDTCCSGGAVRRWETHSNVVFCLRSTHGSRNIRR